MALLLGAALAPGITFGEQLPHQILQGFGADDVGTSFTLLRAGSEPPPQHHRDAGDRGRISLVHNIRSRDQNNLLLFDDPAPVACRRVRGSLGLLTRPGGMGGAIALVPPVLLAEWRAEPPTIHWDEPNIPGVLSIAFDTHNPPTSNWFDKWGNYHQRPQQEVSLHWDGVERANTLSPVEFSEDRPMAVNFEVLAVTGGAEVTLHLNDVAVWDRLFLPHYEPAPLGVAIGACTGEFTSPFEVMGPMAFRFEDSLDSPKPPTRVSPFRRELIHSGNREPKTTAEFPADTGDVGRVVLTLKLECPDGGCDPWDKSAAIYLFDGEERYELLRFITPFGRAYTWKADVTDFLPLLSGERRVGLFVDTWMGESEDPAKQQGWLVSVDLDFHEGPAPRHPIAVQNLWEGFFQYGNPTGPMEENLQLKSVPVPEGATSARVRLMVTGHGMSPATNNAGEFMPADRTLRVNGTEWKHRLWNEDVYLNPCRPQGGTWKFDRAGWAPGSVVTPWMVELDAAMLESGTLELEYIPMPYTNHNYREGAAWHWFETQVVFYSDSD